MAETKINEAEVMSDEELDQVVGGSYDQMRVDVAFFKALGYDGLTEQSSVGIRYKFDEYGVYFHANFGDNDYVINEIGARHPHWATLGYVLTKANYPGFNGDWTNESYTKGFLKNNMGLDISKL